MLWWMNRPFIGYYDDGGLVQEPRSLTSLSIVRSILIS